MTSNLRGLRKADPKGSRKGGFSQKSQPPFTSELTESGIMPKKAGHGPQAELRARRRELGIRTMEAFLFERELQDLDAVKTRLNLSSRSEVLRLLLAKTDLNSLTPDDTAVLNKDAA